MSEVFSSVRNINKIFMPPIIISEALLQYIRDKKNIVAYTEIGRITLVMLLTYVLDAIL